VTIYPEFPFALMTAACKLHEPLMFL